MAATLAVPAEAMRGRRSLGGDHPGADHDQLDRGPAQERGLIRTGQRRITIKDQGALRQIAGPRT
jgi:hypothetical protein